MINPFRPGDYLIVDDIHGKEHFRSDVARDWDGSLRIAEDMDGKHPNIDFKTIVYTVQPDLLFTPVPVSAVALSSLPTFVGNTTVLRPKGPADHLFEND